ncbi:MAG: pyrroline-5-carboxylate reductase [Clostridiales bacterium]|nr:pyrroline-5-carboxylate reductase [Candidatus Crickella merdequi]
MKIGFLGAGAMGGAILSGAVEAGVFEAKDVYVADFSQAIKDKYAAIGCNICEENKDLGQCDIVVFALKPQYAEAAIRSLGNALDGKAVISIMAGLKAQAVRDMVEGDIRLLRLMPNTPALVNAGAFALDAGTDLTAEEKAFAEELFGALGHFEWMPEHLIDTATGLSGAGPAYVYMFIEALADGGVLEGLPRQTALKLAAQTVFGAAKMVLETGQHPDALKDMVCSPGGNTIVGVKTLEEHGFRGACIDTVSKATIRARELGQK